MLAGRYELHSSCPDVFPMPQLRWTPSGYVDDPPTLGLSDQRTRCRGSRGSRSYLSLAEGFAVAQWKFGELVSWWFFQGTRWVGGVSYGNRMGMNQTNWDWTWDWTWNLHGECAKSFMTPAGYQSQALADPIVHRLELVSSCIWPPGSFSTPGIHAVDEDLQVFDIATCSRFRPRSLVASFDRIHSMDIGSFWVARRTMSRQSAFGRGFSPVGKCLAIAGFQGEAIENCRETVDFPRNFEQETQTTPHPNVTGFQKTLHEAMEGYPACPWKVFSLCLHLLQNISRLCTQRYTKEKPGSILYLRSWSGILIPHDAKKSQLHRCPFLMGAC